MSTTIVTNTISKWWLCAEYNDMKTELVEFLQGFARGGKVCVSNQSLLVPPTICLGVLGGVTERRGGIL